VQAQILPRSNIQSGNHVATPFDVEISGEKSAHFTTPSM
jgi:hypothetical protein